MQKRALFLLSLPFLCAGCGCTGKNGALGNTEKVRTTLLIRSAYGGALDSFFSGLPIDGRFANGRNPSMLYARKQPVGPSCKSRTEPSAVERMISRMQHFLGLSTVVYAQGPDDCAGCYQKQTTYSCVPFCGNVQSVTVVDYNILEGSYYAGDTGCTPPSCTSPEWFTCDRTNGCP